MFKCYTSVAYGTLVVSTYLALVSIASRQVFDTCRRLVLNAFQMRHVSW